MAVTEHMQSPGSLVLYKFGKAAKPEVVFILVVNPHFTWQLSYHGKLLGPSTYLQLSGGCAFCVHHSFRCGENTSDAEWLPYLCEEP